MSEATPALDLSASLCFLNEALAEWRYEASVSHVSANGDLEFEVPVNQAFSEDEEDELDKRIRGVSKLGPVDERIQAVFVFLMYRGSVTHSWAYLPG